MRGESCKSCCVFITKLKFVVKRKMDFKMAFFFPPGVSLNFDDQLFGNPVTSPVQWHRIR